MPKMIDRNILVCSASEDEGGVIAFILSAKISWVNGAIASTPAEISEYLARVPADGAILVRTTQRRADSALLEALQGRVRPVIEVRPETERRFYNCVATRVVPAGDMAALVDAVRTVCGSKRHPVRRRTPKEVA